ncbi:MAG: hypothetical protein U0401_12220 [Anaerolineae bacterium]
MLLLRGVIKGQPSAELGREIGVSRQTLLELRHKTQSLADQHQPQSALTDERTETDEMFQNAGEKGDYHPDPADDGSAQAAVLLSKQGTQAQFHHRAGLRSAA